MVTNTTVYYCPLMSAAVYCCLLLYIAVSIVYYCFLLSTVPPDSINTHIPCASFHFVYKWFILYFGWVVIVKVFIYSRFFSHQFYFILLINDLFFIYSHLFYSGWPWNKCSLFYFINKQFIPHLFKFILFRLVPE